jgi:hypothetical protein
MTLSRKLKTRLLVALIAVMGLGAADVFTGANSFSLISPAEARVGRPLTPVSVAGVARRTTRRCAAGVYNC